MFNESNYRHRPDLVSYFLPLVDLSVAFLNEAPQVLYGDFAGCIYARMWYLYLDEHSTAGLILKP